MDDLKRWQRFRDKCNYPFEKEKEGQWCSRINKKCSIDNCPYKNEPSPPLVADGTRKTEKKASIDTAIDSTLLLTKNEQKALSLSNQKKPKLSQKAIGGLMGISKQRVSVLIQSAKGKLNITRYLNKTAIDSQRPPLTKPHGLKRDFWRIHNDEIYFEIEPIDFLHEKPIKFGSTEYLKIKTPDFYIQLFKVSIKIRFIKDIKEETAKKGQAKAEARIKDFLKNYAQIDKRLEKISLKGDMVRISREFAYMDSAIARRFIKERKKLYIYHRKDGILRKVIDFSRSEGQRRPEEEQVHPETAADDSIGVDDFYEDLMHEKVDKLSVTKYKIDNLMEIVGKSSELVGKFAEQQGAYAEEIKRHREAIQQMSKVMASIDKFIKSNSKK